MDARGVTVRETVNAHRRKFTAEELSGLFQGATALHAARGKSVVSFDPRSDGADEIAAKVLGRSGTLRAPAARVGTTCLVGFHEEMWARVIG